MTTGNELRKKAIRAIFIDAFNQKVTEIEFIPELEAYYRLLRCDCITTGYRFPNNDILFVDDSGLLKDPKHFFRIPGIDYDFAGNGIIVGTDPESDGEEADAKTRGPFFGVYFGAAA